MAKHTTTKITAGYYTYRGYEILAREDRTWVIHHDGAPSWSCEADGLRHAVAVIDNYTPRQRARHSRTRAAFR